MRNYLDMLAYIRDNGTRQPNRTGVDAISVPGYMLKFDQRDGFPLVTTKKMAVKGIKGELKGFLTGSTSAADFRAFGCNIWNQNANEDGVDPFGNVVPNKWLTNPNRKGEDDLGRIYGAQWRDWRGKPIIKSATPISRTNDMMNFVADVDYVSIDQVQVAIDTIRKDPTSRRIIINAWRPDEFDQMALPPCHVLYQFIVDTTNGLLHLCMYQRSCDSYLGVPFNIASASMLQCIVAKLTGYTAGTFTHFLADAHLYVNQLEKVEYQLTLEPRPLPQLILSDHGWDIDTIMPEDIQFGGYDPHIWDSAVPMAV